MLEPILRAESSGRLRLVPRSGGCVERLEPVRRQHRRGPARVVRDDPQGQLARRTVLDRLAMSLEDLRPAIENRPAGELALRVVPDYPGRTPPVLPADWLKPLHAHS